MDKLQLGGDFMTADEILDKFVKPQLGIAADLQEKFKKMALAE